MNKYSLDSAFGHAKPGSPRHAIARDTKRILEAHAPDVAAMAEGADWSVTTQDGVRSAISELPNRGGLRENVGNAISHVIAFGRKAGLWVHEPWPLRLPSPIAPDRMRAKDQKRLEQTDADRTKFLENIPQVLDSRDRAVLQGAMLFSSALVGGLMHQKLLLQLNASAQLQEYNGLRWIDFGLGGGQKREVWRNPRRWFPDELTVFLLAKLDGLPRTKGPETALMALAKCISIPAYGLEALACAARLWWSTRLPSYLIEYGTQLQLAPSVPAPTFKRILTNAPLKCPSKDERRSSASHGPQVIDATDDGSAARRRPPPSSKDGILQLEAVKRLLRLLRKHKRGKKLSPSKIQLRLVTWDRDFDHIGGWVWLLREWTDQTLRASKGRRRAGLNRGGLLRYLEGFALSWIATMDDLPPEAVEDRLDELDERLSALANELATLNSASIARTGLATFLGFVRNHGGPHIVLGSEWEDVLSCSEARANLFTPAEFLRLQQRLGETFASGSLPGMRVQVMAALAYTTGLRWELLHTLRYQDVLFMEGDEARGVVLRRSNTYVDGKTAPKGGVCLEHVMHLDDRCIMRRYIQEARRAAGASDNHFIFADPQTPHLPPSPALTRDLIQKNMREVTGDPTLRFHDLRHSAANLAMVSVAWPLDGASSALAWLADFSAQARGITQGSYAELVTGRTHTDRARLYFVADLLGHSTPTTTMRSYLHVVDAVFAEAICRRADLPRGVRAVIRGVSEGAIRKEEYRGRKAAPEALQRGGLR